MRKIINDPADLVVQSLTGLCLAHPDLLTLRTDPLCVLRSAGPVPGKVAVISGGGSGHEPLHAGFVGRGMLAAAVPGAVFTSPTPDQILAAIKAADGGAGVLLLVKNYTGDVLNFEMAAELADADGLAVASVLIDDDVAVTDSTYTAGRRGVAGTVLVEKIAGAAAERGDSLEQVSAIARRVNSELRSMAVALAPCVVPQSGEPSFSLPAGQMEVGVGIHGEPGRSRAPIRSADEIVGLLLDAVCQDLPFSRDDDVLLVVNGLGGTPQIELYTAFAGAHRQLTERGIAVRRSLVGSYVTALEMQGLSVTLLRLSDELTQLWDAPVATATLRWGSFEGETV